MSFQPMHSIDSLAVADGDNSGGHCSVRAAVVGLQTETVLNVYWQQVVIYFCWLGSANIEHCLIMCVTHIWEMRSPFVSSIKTENWMPSTTKNAPTWRTLLIYSVICYWTILLNLGLLSCDIDLKTKRNTTFYYRLRLPYYSSRTVFYRVKNALCSCILYFPISTERLYLCASVCVCVLRFRVKITMTSMIE